MLQKRKAFTLAEVMITLAVLGILASIILPAVSRIRPNKSKAMFKKAYYVAERMVYELVNDQDLYPSNGSYVGFDNTATASYLGIEYPTNNTGSSANAGEGAKFCQLFARKLNTASDDIYCDAAHSVPTGGGTFKAPSFITSDGIHWYMPYSDFKPINTKNYIYVDVNGPKAPNCRCTDANCYDCATPDIFQIVLLPDGKMSVESTIEKAYLKSNDSMQDARDH
ncbi:MAG: type II secretion system protein [Candidatus Gastranaerophilaceae bacterium]|nr:type II secretion system protein [Candidatus Gastranaerophilaceae bacterium]